MYVLKLLLGVVALTTEVELVLTLLTDVAEAGVAKVAEVAVTISGNVAETTKTVKI